MSLNEIFILIGKAIFCYFFIFIVLRIMGKREVGELSTFDMVVFLVISDLFSIALNDINESLWVAIIPVVVIVILQIITAYLSLKNKKIRNIFEGKPSYVIINGKINYNELKKNRYNLDDLLMELRMKDIESPFDCAFALLESNGELTIIKKDAQKLKYPEAIISDGEINDEALKFLKISRVELMKIIATYGYQKIEDVFLCMSLLDGTFYFVPKETFIDKNTIKSD